MAGDTPGRECPYEDFGMRPQIGTENMSDSIVPDTFSGSPYGGGATAEWRVYDGWRCWIAEWGETLASPDVAGSLLPVVPTGGPPLLDAVDPARPDGPVVAGGPVGLCETPSPSFCGSLDPLEHLVLDFAGPDGRYVAVGPVGPFRTLSSSDCHPAGRAGPYVAGGPVGPDYFFKAFGSGPY